MNIRKFINVNTTNNLIGGDRLLIFLSSIFFLLQMIQTSFQQNKGQGNSQPQEGPPYHPGHLDQKSVGPLKNAFNHWIRSLPMEERFMALKIYSGPIPQVLRKKLAKLQLPSHQRGSEMLPNLQHAPLKEEVSSEVKKSFRKIQKGFNESVVLVSDGHQFFDHICFEYGLLECPEKLFELLSSPVQRNDAKLMFQAIHKHEEIEAIVQKMLASSTIDELFRVTLTYLRQETLLRFRQSMANPDFITKGLQEERRRKKEFSLHLKHLSQDLKRKMILVGFKDVQQLRQWLLSYGIKIDYAQLQNETQELLKVEKNEFINRIFKCKLKKANSPIIDYHEHVYNFWKKEVSKSKKRRFPKYNAIEEPEFGLEQLPMEYQPIRTNVFQQNKNKTKPKKSASIESNKTNVTSATNATDGDKKLLKRKTNFEFTGSLARLSPKDEEKKRDISDSKDESSFDLDKKQKRFNRKRKEKTSKNEGGLERPQSKKLKIIELQSKIAQLELEFPTSSSGLSKLELIKKLPIGLQYLKQISTSIITEELQDFSDKISEEANLHHERRLVAFERIQFLLSFYYIQIELFGSCASGIAIQNSDIDIAVKSEILNYFEHVPEHFRLQAALNNLHQILSTQPYLTDINLIAKASIPIIKLKVDTSVPCLDPQYGQAYSRLNRPHNSGVIEADITIQTLNMHSQRDHLGIQSTQIVNGWLQSIPSLHYIVLTLKYLLQSKNLHKTYDGGLNTFSLILLLVSYIYHAKLDKETNIALVLEEILKFYAFQFNQKQTVIDLGNHGKKSIFQSKQDKDTSDLDSRDQADLEIIDPNCQGRVITRKCYKFPEIKEFFKEILHCCFEQPFKELEEIMESSNLRYIKTKEFKQKENRFELLLKQN